MSLLSIPFAVIFLPALAVLLAGTAWQLFLAARAIAYIVRKPIRENSNAGAQTFFHIVIPAHNEASGIEASVNAAFKLEYPAGMYRVLVVADNCTDDTAVLARNAGADVLKRTDTARRGKGYALRYAFDHILSAISDKADSPNIAQHADETSAVVVMDADTFPAPDLLTEFDRHLCTAPRKETAMTGRSSEYPAGCSGVLQSENGVHNPDDSALTWLLHVGNVMENRLFHLPKSLMGLPASLRGNGMCFRADILRRFPWNAFSVTEDREYTLTLLRNGISPQLVPQTAVRSQFPSSVDQLRQQRLRWATGDDEAAGNGAWQLMKQGISTRNLDLFDAGFSMIVLSRPKTLLLIALTLLLAHLFYPSIAPLVWAAAAGQALLLAAGMAAAGITLRRIYWTVSLPVVAGWLTIITILGMAGAGKTQWTRTKRV